MERVLQWSFKSSHYHTIGHTRGTFGGGKYYHCSWIFSCCQTGRLGRLRWNLTWYTQSLEQKSSSADSCVSRDLVFWKSTERLANWAITPYTERETGENAINTGASLSLVRWETYMSHVLKKMPLNNWNKAGGYPQSKPLGFLVIPTGWVPMSGMKVMSLVGLFDHWAPYW